MRSSRPSTGTILGAIALYVALGGTAVAATGSLVNIADPTNAARIAHVNASGALQTSGSASVTNTVTTRLAAPSAYVHTVRLFIGATCEQVAATPTGHPALAMIVRQVRINVFEDPSPGTGNLELYPDTDCSGTPVADVTPPTVAETTVPFDPGLGVPAGSGLSATAIGLGVEVYTDGYSVASSLVPAARVTTTGLKAPQHQH